MKKLLLTLFLTATFLSFNYDEVFKTGFVDHACVSDCLSMGYLYGYCVKICSY